MVHVPILGQRKGTFATPFSKFFTRLMIRHRYSMTGLVFADND